MLKNVTITDLQRRAAEVINDLADEPVIISQRGRPAAVLLSADVFERIERELQEVEAQRVREIVEVGLASYEAGKTSSHDAVARRARKARARATK
jgi:prevent-host-death family protein